MIFVPLSSPSIISKGKIAIRSPWGHRLLSRGNEPCRCREPWMATNFFTMAAWTGRGQHLGIYFHGSAVEEALCWFSEVVFKA